jgi:hypothetical protein
MMMLGADEKPEAVLSPVKVAVVVGGLVAAAVVINHFIRPQRAIALNGGIKPFRTAGIFDGRSGW